MKKIGFAILLSMAFCLAGEYRYNFTYTFQGQAHGMVLLVIPFRVYYESSASVNFLARQSERGNLDFQYDTTGETGYMMRTSGFGGKTLMVLTADYDYDVSLPFGEKKLGEIEGKAPHYAGYIKRKKNFQFKILSRNPDSIRFSRSVTGVYSDCYIDFPVQFRYHPEVLNVDFFIYPIMIEILRGYDHAFVNTEDLQKKEFTPGNNWQSPPLDYSPHMNRIAPLAARVMEQLRPFRQQSPFHLQYQVESNASGVLEISGSAAPNIPIWGSFLISKFSRNIRTSLNLRIPLEDSLTIEISDSKRNKLMVTATLRRID